MTAPFYCERTTYGFRWGPMEVERLVSDHRGGVLIAIRTGHKRVEIRVSPKGNKIDVGEVRADYK